MYNRTAQSFVHNPGMLLVRQCRMKDHLTMAFDSGFSQRFAFVQYKSHNIDECTLGRHSNIKIDVSCRK